MPRAAHSSPDGLRGLEVAIATNNGDIGGGEVMLLQIAEALRANEMRVTVVAPRAPAGVADAAREAGFVVQVLDADGRRDWMRELRRWDSRDRKGILWCNGLVPSFATSGHRNRVVHLHQEPATTMQRMLATVARRGAMATVVPSQAMARHLRDARVLSNWTPPMRPTARTRGGQPFTVGFLGRPSPDKGVPVLAEAVRLLDERSPGNYRLLIGGEPRFVTPDAQAAVEAALEPIAGLTVLRGWVTPADFFDEIDLLAVPSVWEEPFGLVAAEAMASRVPVVVSDAGALPEVVGNGYPLVVRAGDSRALAGAIRAAASGEVRVDVAAQYERWSEWFSPEAGAGRVRDLLTDITS